MNHENITVYRGSNAFFIKYNTSEEGVYLHKFLNDNVEENSVVKILEMGINLILVTNFPKNGCGDVRKILDKVRIELNHAKTFDLDEVQNHKDKLFTDYGFIVKINDKIYNEVGTLLDAVLKLAEPAKLTISDCKYIVEIYNSTLTKGTRISDGNLLLKNLALVDEFKNGFRDVVVQKLYDAYKMLRYITKKVDRRLMDNVSETEV